MTPSFGRLTSSISVAFALLAACAAPQSQVPRALSEYTETGSSADRTELHGQQRSWMSPDASRQSRLLYVSDDSDNDLYVFSLPGGKLVGTITGFLGLAGVCSDAKGNVFAVDYQNASIKEYRHGGNEPIAVLNDPNATPLSCSVDRSTENLAVTNQITTVSGATEPGDVAIYSKAQGTPQTLYDANMVYVSFDSYDSAGNLYVSGVAPSYQDSTFAVLDKGGTKLKDLTLNQAFCCDQSSAVQWDGQYLAVANETGDETYQFSIKGTGGMEVGTTTLAATSRIFGFWIQSHNLYAPVVSNGQPMLGFYAYPGGGQPTKSLFGFASAFAATVSLRP